MKPETQFQQTQRSETVRLELWVRSLAPSGYRTQQEEILKRMKKLDADDVIGSYTVALWGDRLPESANVRTPVGQHIHNRIEAFRAWGTDHAVSPDSFFPTTSIRSKRTDEEDTQIQLPLMALAEYEGGDLRFISPCTHDETVHTVADRLAVIERTAPVVAPRQLRGDHTVPLGRRP